MDRYYFSSKISKLLWFSGHIQISQVPDRSEPDDHGEINYKHIFKLLQKLQYQHWIGCEYTPTLGINFDAFKNPLQNPYISDTFPMPKGWFT